MVSIKSNIDEALKHLDAFQRAIPAWVHSMLEPAKWLPEFKATARDALMAIADAEERDIVDLFVDTVTTETLGRTGLMAKIFGPIDREEIDQSGLPTYDEIVQWVNTPFEDGGKDLTAADVVDMDALPSKLNSIIYFKHAGWEGLAKAVTEFISKKHGTQRTREWLMTVLRAWVEFARRRFPGELRIAVRRAWHATK